ncbi:hypothetical protein BH18ACT8_BH18ACT8_17800 [soil metagenome]
MRLGGSSLSEGSTGHRCGLLPGRPTWIRPAMNIVTRSTDWTGNLTKDLASVAAWTFGALALGAVTLRRRTA